KLTALLRNWSAKNPARAPLLIAADYEGGTVFSPSTLGLSDLPANMMLGAAGDARQAASLAYLAGMELRRAGIDMNFGPVLDVNTQSRNPAIGIRSIGSDPGLVSAIGAALIDGFRTAGVISVAKHFPGQGAAWLDSHKTLPVLKITETELNAVHLPPFKKALEAQVPGIMTAHVVFTALDKNLPATLSPAVIENLLHKKMGFKGFVITDSLDMKAISSKRSMAEGAVLAVKAGADMVLIGGGNPLETRDALTKAVREGVIPAERLEEAYQRVLNVKKHAARIAQEKPSVSESGKAYLLISEEIAAGAVTLVRDTAGLIPLSGRFDVKKSSVCVIMFSPPRFADDLLALPKIFYAGGWKTVQYTASTDPDNDEKNRALEYANNADILIVGSFQWADIQNKKQTKLIRTLLSTGKPTVLVSLMSPYDIPRFPGAGTVLATYGITESSMKALGGILTGKTEARGKLPVKLN
ncbi:MAG: glycoside hydrolase family 3 N-terminal domain-containing protein, partial [bacterium]